MYLQLYCTALQMMNSTNTEFFLYPDQHIFLSFSKSSSTAPPLQEKWFLQFPTTFLGNPIYSKSILTERLSADSEHPSLLSSPAPPLSLLTPMFRNPARCSRLMQSFEPSQMLEPVLQNQPVPEELVRTIRHETPEATRQTLTWGESLAGSHVAPKSPGLPNCKRKGSEKARFTE